MDASCPGGHPPGEKAAFFREVSIDQAVADTPLARRFAEGAVITSDQIPLNDYRAGKRALHIGGKYGSACHLCSSLSSRYICCSTQVPRTMSNCPYDCAYCFLQNYLTNGTSQVVADVSALVAEVSEAAAASPWRLLRIGTWELADSLALEGLLGNSRELIEGVSAIDNILLELRTKSAVIAPILGANHGGRAIISFSLNPQTIISSEEHGTADLAARLSAMERAMDDGYLLALHFDPMIHYDAWQTGYADLVKKIVKSIDPSRITWISLGVLRFNPEMRRVIEDNFPRSRLTSAQLVAGPDGKVRYIKPLRRAMFRFMVDLFRDSWGERTPFIYLCMETKEVWRRVFGASPASVQHLDYLLADTMHERFPQIARLKPFRARYEAISGLPTR